MSYNRSKEEIHMKYERIPLGPLQTNGYLIYEDGKALIIDPGGEVDKLLSRVKELNLEIEAVLLTHAHFDHIGALEQVRDELKCPVYLHKEEKDWLGSPQLNGSGVFPGIEPVECREADHLWKEEGEKQVGSFFFYLFETPGHSPGSVTYYFINEEAAFSGDVLFRGGVGRTDLHGGDQETLMKSIHDKLLVMNDETEILNGHGPSTVIGEEKETNPFINGFGW
jgi:hydroxyacylglutathione hydrolase